MRNPRRCGVVRIRLFLMALLLFAVPAYSAGTAINGDWRLTITGQSLFFYGTRMLTAGLTQNWKVEIDFQVKNNFHLVNKLNGLRLKTF